MEISKRGLELIKHFEGCKLQAYPDSKGVPTIGTGHTNGVKLGDTCTQEEADLWLKGDVAIAEAAVNRLVSVELTQNQFDALTSFTFNLGTGNLLGSTLLRKLNLGQYEEASAEFPKWNRCGGKVLDGLTKRRLAEQQLFRERANNGI